MTLDDEAAFLLQGKFTVTAEESIYSYWDMIVEPVLMSLWNTGLLGAWPSIRKGMLERGKAICYWHQLVLAIVMTWKSLFL